MTILQSQTSTTFSTTIPNKSRISVLGKFTIGAIMSIIAGIASAEENTIKPLSTTCYGEITKKDENFAGCVLTFKSGQTRGRSEELCSFDKGEFLIKDNYWLTSELIGTTADKFKRRCGQIF